MGEFVEPSSPPGSELPTDPPEADVTRPSDPRAPDARFERCQLLGTGSMGAVYLLRDRETGEQLALKRLFGFDAKTVMRIKREFRSLANLSHPNLVSMYDLGKDEDGWFLTMEYVDGEGFDAYTAIDCLSTLAEEGSLSELTDFRMRLQERLLPAFRQLAEGIHALHGAGMLHRDLKPSNVLVTGRRVVVLDFGLVRDLDAGASAMTVEGGIVGTPAYMAPEQARGQRLSEVTDWYAFGTMLYEALTGRLPFVGHTFDVLHAKLEGEPRPPRHLNPEVPEDVDAFCMALLARAPERRPTGMAVLERFRHWTEGDNGRSGVASSSDHSAAARPGKPASRSVLPFFGRAREREQLWEAFRGVERGQPRVVHLRGASGGGKSALAERFLDEVERTSGPTRLVLRSRCYEREAMPFKALDGVVDALCRHLATQHDVEVSNLLPMDVAVLAQLFPVLGRLRPVQHLLSVGSGDGSTQQGRRRAESALRELIERLSAHTPLVIWIDDLQWGDLDSAAILQQWLHGNLTGPVLLLLSYRSDEVDTSDCLRALLREDRDRGAIGSQTIDVGPLQEQDLRALCQLQLGSYASEFEFLVERIAREAEGSPFLATQLTALSLAKIRRGDEDLGAPSIGDLVSQSMGMLNEDAQRLLKILAVAGRPLPPRLSLRAAGVRRHGREALHALHRMQLVRTRELAGERLVELYHDRVREGVYGALAAPERRQLHHALLSVVEYTDKADADWLHALAAGAGEPVAALRYGLEAAERAMSTLAFERAAELFRSCVQLCDPNAPSRARICQQLAVAEGACGRGLRAADAYLEAASLTPEAHALPLLRRATSHLLRSGRFEQGEALLERVLAALGLRVPQTKAGLIATIAWERARLAARGLSYTPRSEAEIPATTLERIDACNALRNETLSSDPLRATLFLCWQLRWALDAGEPMRVLQALCGVGYLRSTPGTAASARNIDAFIARTAALAEEIGTDEARAQQCATTAIVNWMLGRPERVPELAREAERLYRAQRSNDLDVTYYIRLAVTAAHAGALYEASDYRTFISVLEPALREAREADNRSALLYLSLPEVLYDELCGRSVEAQMRTQAQRPQLPQSGFGIYHALHMGSVCISACLSGDYEWGLRYLEEDWPRYRRSLTRRAAMMSFTAAYFRLRLRLNAALTDPSRDAMRHQLLTEDIPALERHPLQRRIRPLVQMARARLCHYRGERNQALALLDCSEPSVLYVGDNERIRYAKGAILGGQEGLALCTQAVDTLRTLGVPEPRAFLYSAVPELIDDGALALQSNNPR